MRKLKLKCTFNGNGKDQRKIPQTEEFHLRGFAFSLIHLERKLSNFLCKKKKDILFPSSEKYIILHHLLQNNLISFKVFPLGNRMQLEYIFLKCSSFICSFSIIIIYILSPFFTIFVKIILCYALLCHFIYCYIYIDIICRNILK